MTRMDRAAPLGIGFIGLGFLLIFVAWNGAAAKNCVDCQIPYLISGGATGLGLIVIGCSLLLFESARRDRVHTEARLAELIEVLREQHAGGPVTVEAAPSAAAPRTTPVPAVNGNTVVIGRSSFHRPDCRLVDGKEDVTYASRPDAEAQGLQPCRVCDPTAAPVKSKR